MDAYLQSLHDGKPIDLDELKSLMISHAIAWKETIIERCKEKEIDLPMCQNKIVLCCAYSYIKGIIWYDPKKQYLIVVDDLSDNWIDRMEFVCDTFNSNWDVT